MVQTAKYLVIGSLEPFGGKTGVILGIIHQLKSRNIDVSYIKPISSSFDEEEDVDTKLIEKILSLPQDRIVPPLIHMDWDKISQKIENQDTNNYLSNVISQIKSIQGDLVLIEGAGTLDEGALFGMSLSEMAEKIDCPVVLVVKTKGYPPVDSILKAKKELGNRLIGIVINGVLPEQVEMIQTQLKSYLISQGISILGILPQNSLLASISVREIAKQLRARILCRSDRLDLMVESLMIGAMNVNAALEYFRKYRNKAVVTGSDRTDLHFAALETSTSCLILTGTTPPDPILLSRAEDLEVPVLAVNLDTLTTIEIIENSFGKARIQEDIKINCIQELMAQYFDFAHLLERLKL
ncbi:MAG: phosphotransacetylase family protein [Cyanobacteriota bacterium ELA615]